MPTKDSIQRPGEGAVPHLQEMSFSTFTAPMEFWAQGQVW